jgi:antitoxin (DNA-binding transcriptional repressor) of toxin-antitoxin stability system
LFIELVLGQFMLNVTVDEIQRDPLKYLRQVEAGETLVIVRSDKPIAELRPITSNKQLSS